MSGAHLHEGIPIEPLIVYKSTTIRIDGVVPANEAVANRKIVICTINRREYVKVYRGNNSKEKISALSIDSHSCRSLCCDSQSYASFPSFDFENR